MTVIDDGRRLRTVWVGGARIEDVLLLFFLVGSCGKDGVNCGFNGG